MPEAGIETSEGLTPGTPAEAVETGLVAWAAALLAAMALALPVRAPAVAPTYVDYVRDARQIQTHGESDTYWQNPKGDASLWIGQRDGRNVWNVEG